MYCKKGIGEIPLSREDEKGLKFKEEAISG